VSARTTDRGLSASVVAGLTVSLAVGVALLIVLVKRPSDQEHPVAAMLATAGAVLELPPQAAIAWAEAEEGRLSAAVVEIDDDRLRLRVLHGLNPTEAEATTAEQRLQIAELFEDRQAPYPGQLSHTLRCPDAYRPETLAPSGEARLLVRLYANDRMAFGGCSDDLLQYRATIGLFYDPQGERLLRLEYFTPKAVPPEPAEALLRSLRFVDAAPAVVGS
jgi:hypothetical protein